MENRDYISADELEARISKSALDTISFIMVTDGSPADKINQIEGVRRLVSTFICHIRTVRKEQKQDDAG